MGWISIFLWGFLGSIAVEVVSLNQYFSGPGTLPGRYKKTGFWVTRFLLALIAGGVSVAYEIKTPLLAVNVGAATPLIVQALAKGLQNVNVPRDPDRMN